MFDINEDIVYGGYSVCRIIGTEKNDLNGNMIDYYVLRPAFDPGSKIFVPMNNEKLTRKMHRLISETEVYELIRIIPDLQIVWIENESERREIYREALLKRDRREIINIIKTLRSHKQEQLEKKRRLHIYDEKILKEAEKTLFEEFAYILNMDPKGVSDFIDEQLKMIS